MRRRITRRGGRQRRGGAKRVLIRCAWRRSLHWNGRVWIRIVCICKIIIVAVYSDFIFALMMLVIFVLTTWWIRRCRSTLVRAREPEMLNVHDLLHMEIWIILVLLNSMIVIIIACHDVTMFMMSISSMKKLPTCRRGGMSGGLLLRSPESERLPHPGGIVYEH